MSILTDFFQALTSIVTGFLGLLVDATSGVVEIFWTSGVDGGFTIYGVFLLMGLGMFFVMFGWRVIVGFIKK